MVITSTGVNLDTKYCCLSTDTGHKRVVELLLENGARTDVVNGVNKTAVKLGSFVGE